MSLYDRNMGAATGLSMVHKVKYEHIFLGAFSKMRVDLAAQVSKGEIPRVRHNSLHHAGPE